MADLPDCHWPARDRRRPGRCSNQHVRSDPTWSPVNGHPPRVIRHRSNRRATPRCGIACGRPILACRVRSARNRPGCVRVGALAVRSESRRLRGGHSEGTSGRPAALGPPNRNAMLAWPPTRLRSTTARPGGRSKQEARSRAPGNLLLRPTTRPNRTARRP